MTDRVNALTVVLRADVREDDVKPLLDAISLLEGVLEVVPQVTSPQSYVAERRVRAELRDHIMGCLV